MTVDAMWESKASPRGRQADLGCIPAAEASEDVCIACRWVEFVEQVPGALQAALNIPQGDPALDCMHRAQHIRPNALRLLPLQISPSLLALDDPHNSTINQQITRIPIEALAMCAQLQQLLHEVL